MYQPAINNPYAHEQLLQLLCAFSLAFPGAQLHE